MLFSLPFLLCHWVRKAQDLDYVLLKRKAENGILAVKKEFIKKEELGSRGFPPVQCLIPWAIATETERTPSWKGGVCLLYCVLLVLSLSPSPQFGFVTFLLRRWFAVVPS